MDYLMLTKLEAKVSKEWPILIIVKNIKYFESHPCEKGNSKVVLNDNTTFIVKETIAEIEQLIFNRLR